LLSVTSRPGEFVRGWMRSVIQQSVWRKKIKETPTQHREFSRLRMWSSTYESRERVRIVFRFKPNLKRYKGICNSGKEQADSSTIKLILSRDEFERKYWDFYNFLDQVICGDMPISCWSMWIFSGELVPWMHLATVWLANMAFGHRFPLAEILNVENLSFRRLSKIVKPSSRVVCINTDWRRRWRSR